MAGTTSLTNLVYLSLRMSITLCYFPILIVILLAWWDFWYGVVTSLAVMFASPAKPPPSPSSSSPLPQEEQPTPTKPPPPVNTPELQAQRLQLHDCSILIRHTIEEYYTLQSRYISAERDAGFPGRSIDAFEHPSRPTLLSNERLIEITTSFRCLKVALKPPTPAVEKATPSETSDLGLSREQVSAVLAVTCFLVHLVFALIEYADKGQIVLGLETAEDVKAVLAGWAACAVMIGLSVIVCVCRRHVWGEAEAKLDVEAARGEPDGEVGLSRTLAGVSDGDETGDWAVVEEKSDVSCRTAEAREVR